MSRLFKSTSAFASEKQKRAFLLFCELRMKSNWLDLYVLYLGNRNHAMYGLVLLHSMLVVSEELHTVS